MRPIFKSFGHRGVAVGLAAILCASTPLAAAPLGSPVDLRMVPSTSAPSVADGEAKVEQARWRGRGWRGHHRRWGHRGGNRWVGPAIAGLVIGGAIASASRRDRYYDDGYYGSYRSYGSYGGDGVSRCAATFRSFDPSDGTYQPYGGGPRALCPYL